MTPQPLSSTAKAGEVANNASPGADDFTFLPDGTGFDVWRLDCAVENLRGADLTAWATDLRRIRDNLNDLMETANGHAH